MKKIILLTLIALGSYTHITNAALISVGPYAIDDTATISSISNINNLFSSNASTSAITDIDASTYLYGNPNNSQPGGAQLGFSRNIYNGPEADLVFYFLRGDGDADIASFDITIAGLTSTYNANLSTFVDNTGATIKYQVAVNNGFADLLTATVNLDDFNITANDFIIDFNLSGLNNNERIALASGFYTSADIVVVPLPTSLFLLLSGLTGLSFFRRTKNNLH